MEPSAWVLVAAVLGSSMAFIDGTVVNVALPALQRDLGATVTDAQWVVEAYALLLAALVLVGGALGDRLGRRRVFAVGVWLFAGASAVCGAAPSVRVLIAARAVQGIAAALLTPGSLAMISAAFSDAARGRAIGTWSASTSITAAIGPVAGGYLVGHASWRWAFFINIPLAAAVLVIIALRVPESRDDSVAGGLDWPGAVLATGGLGALVYGLIHAQEAGFGDPLVLTATAAGAIALAVFTTIEARTGGADSRHHPGARAPMMPLDLFRSRAFSATNGLTLLLYGALGGALFFVPLVLIEVHGYSPAAAGASLLPFIILLSILSRRAGALVPRLGARILLTVGPMVSALGFLLFAVPGASGSYWTTFFPAVMVLGLGMAITVAPLTTTVMGAVDQRHAGIASGINNAVSRTAGLLAVAVFGIVLVHRFDSGLDERIGRRALPAAAVVQLDGQRSRLALADTPQGLTPAQQAGVRSDIDDSFVAGFRAVCVASAGLAALAAGIAAVGLPGRRRGPSTHPPHIEEA